jgi:hypothetical protein
LKDEMKNKVDKLDFKNSEYKIHQLEEAAYKCKSKQESFKTVLEQRDLNQHNMETNFKSMVLSLDRQLK